MTRPPTEHRNPATVNIDLMPAADAVDAILAEDANAIVAARRAVPGLVLAIEGVADRLAAGGRLHYFGAGASGRLAVLDATELTPTFGVAPDLVQAHFPGGVDALIDSSLDLEDADALGAHDATAMTAADVAFGVTASGTTPYVAGALNSARAAGALTVLLTCNPAPGIAADVIIALDTGAEAITGSTRLKAGTATKVALNAFSSALMIRMGRTYSHFMTGMSVTNDKLRERAVQLLSDASGAPLSAAREAWDFADGDTAVALAALLSGATVDEARIALDATRSVRAAVARIEADR